MPDKLKILLSLFLINIIISFAYASNIQDAISAYNSEDYKEALVLFKEEIKLNPENPENYKWLAKTYEALFDVEKSLDAYKTYEKMRRNQDRITLSSPTLKPSTTNTPLPKPNFTPTPKPIIKIKPTPTPKPSLRPTSKPTLLPIYNAWQNVSVLNYSIKKEIKIIPANSVDLNEIMEISESGKSFFIIELSIKYSKNVIIKSNSDQIRVIDKNNHSYFLYAMSTYKFQYKGNNQSERLEVLQVSNYYELSKKDSRNKVKFLFKVDQKSSIKKLSIKGYGDIEIK